MFHNLRLLEVLTNQPHIPAWSHGSNAKRVMKRLALLDRRMVKRGNREVVQYLIHWQGQNRKDATSHYAKKIEKKIPGLCTDTRNLSTSLI